MQAMFFKFFLCAGKLGLHESSHYGFQGVCVCACACRGQWTWSWLGLHWPTPGGWGREPFDAGCEPAVDHGN